MNKPDWVPELWREARNALSFDGDELFFYDGTKPWSAIDTLLARHTLPLAEALKHWAIAVEERARKCGSPPIIEAMGELEGLERTFLVATELTDWTDAGDRQSLARAVSRHAKKTSCALRELMKTQKAGTATLPPAITQRVTDALAAMGVPLAALQAWQGPPPARASWDRGHPYNTEAHQVPALLLKLLEVLAVGANESAGSKPPVSRRSDGPMRTYFMRLFAGDLLALHWDRWPELVARVLIPITNALFQAMPSLPDLETESVMRALHREVRRPIVEAQEYLCRLDDADRADFVRRLFDGLGLPDPESDTTA